MLLLEPHGEVFKKKEAQKAGAIIFSGKPSQGYLFNFLCGISEKENGVVCISFQSIATHMSKVLMKTMTVQAVSQLVKKLVAVGAIDYLTIKEEGNRYAVGTFRIMTRRSLFALAGKVKRLLDEKVAAAKARLASARAEQVVCDEDVKDGKAAIAGTLSPSKTAKKPYQKAPIKSDKKYLPTWATPSYSYKENPMSPAQIAELEDLILGLKS